jgi:hypothetical protein
VVYTFVLWCRIGGGTSRRWVLCHLGMGICCSGDGSWGRGRDLGNWGRGLAAEGRVLEAGAEAVLLGAE